MYKPDINSQDIQSKVISYWFTSSNYVPPFSPTMSQIFYLKIESISRLNHWLGIASWSNCFSKYCHRYTPGLCIPNLIHISKSNWAYKQEQQMYLMCQRRQNVVWCSVVYNSLIGSLEYDLIFPWTLACWVFVKEGMLLLCPNSGALHSQREDWRCHQWDQLRTSKARSKISRAQRWNEDRKLVWGTEGLLMR